MSIRHWFEISALSAVLTACSGGGDAHGGGGGSTGGAAGSAGIGAGGGGPASCPAGLVEYGPTDIDLSLGGLNADLPDPSTSCLDVTQTTSMCAAVTLSIGSTTREFLCTNPSFSAVDGSSLSCANDAGELFSVTTHAFGGAVPPATFALTQAEIPDSVTLELSEGKFGGLNADPATALAINGWVNKFFDQWYGCDNAMYGVFAATWPDAGSGEVRARGSFQARSFGF